MILTAISSNSKIHNIASNRAQQTSGTDVRAAFADLAQALQSGDLEGAQQAFATIQSVWSTRINSIETPNGSTSTHQDTLNSGGHALSSDTSELAHKTGLILLRPTIIDLYYWQAAGRFMLVDHPQSSEPSVLREIPPDGIRYGSRAMAIEKGWETANEILQQEGVTPGRTTRLIWDEQFKMFGPRA
jgi:hypothetical protein